jgi:hypothetical protein
VLKYKKIRLLKIFVFPKRNFLDLPPFFCASLGV